MVLVTKNIAKRDVTHLFTPLTIGGLTLKNRALRQEVLMT
mgnify:CR=1 FL=1